VKVDLIVRGICCLRPGIPGVSENITVRSIVGRFLEHSRIFYFANGSDPQVFIGSADWMPRNFFRRIETVVPVEEPVLRKRIIDEILGAQLADNAKASVLNEDGTYARVLRPKGAVPRHSQEEFMMLSSGETKRRRKRILPPAAPALTVRTAP